MENKPFKLSKPSKLASQKQKLLDFCREPHSRDEMMAHIGVTGVEYFRKKYLVPMQRDGLLRKVELDKPTSRHQKYIALERERG